MKKIAFIFAFFLIVFATCGSAQHVNAFGGGTGSLGDPFLIQDCDDLQGMQDDLDAAYKLVNDIDCDVTPYNTGDGFEQIGINWGSPFTGSLDGAGHVIQNLFINRPFTSYVGLFGVTDNAEIFSLGLENIDITGFFNVAGIVGYSQNSSIENVFITGSITSGSFGMNSWAGGLLGYSSNDSIANTYTSVTVAAEENNVGGLVGQSSGSTIKNSFATGTASNTNGGVRLGALVGQNTGTITNSYSVGSTLVGENSGTVNGNSAGEQLLSSFYQTTPLHAVYTGTPSWNLTTLWNFINGSSLPILDLRVVPTPTPQSGGSSGNSNTPPTCTNASPSSAPNLFQIKNGPSSATLYFAPVSGQNSGYAISYGTTASADQFAVSFNLGFSSGAVTYTINSLYPGVWYFKVRGQNGCMPGNWSQIMQTRVSKFGNSLVTNNFLKPVLGVSTENLNNKQCNPIYTVESGDTLWKIASENLGSGVRYNSIMEQNGLSSTSLKLGQTLKISCQ